MADFADGNVSRLITELRAMAAHGENCRADNLTATQAADALEQQERFLEARYEAQIPSAMVNVINEQGDAIKRVRAVAEEWSHFEQEARGCAENVLAALENRDVRF